MTKIILKKKIILGGKKKHVKNGKKKKKKHVGNGKKNTKKKTY